MKNCSVAERPLRKRAKASAGPGVCFSSVALSHWAYHQGKAWP